MNTNTLNLCLFLFFNHKFVFLLTANHTAPISALATVAPSNQSQMAYQLPDHLIGHNEKGEHNNVSPIISSSSSGSSDQPVIDCVVTPWSEWSECSHTCGNGGRKTRRRMIKSNPQNGGKSCPRKLIQRRRCKNMPPCRK